MVKWKQANLVILLLFAFLFIACPIPPIPPQPPIPHLPPEPPIPPIEYVYVDTCKDSLEMRNTRCPDDRIEFNKKYIKGTEPTTWCSFHKKPPDPPPPILAPSAPYIGTSFYQLQTESEENIRWFIEKLREHKANATEIFLVFDWPLAKSAPWKSYPGSGWKFSPYKIVGDWSEPKFGSYKFPTFNLDMWNPETWAKLQFIMEECRRNGIALFIRIQDYCSVKSPFYKRHYPYNNGSNAQVYTGGTWGKPIRKWYKKFNRKLMRTIAQAALQHYFIIPMNEADVLGNDSEEWKDRALREFHQFYIDDFMALGVKKEQFILNIFRPNVFNHFRALKYRMEIHGIASPQAMASAFQSFGNDIFPNGDGPDPFAKGFAHFKGYREASFNQGIKMGGQLQGKFGYCYLERKPEETVIADVRKAVFVALDGIIKGLNGPRPPPPPPIDKTFSVSGNKFYYGDDEIKLAGCSRLEALWRALRIRGFDEGWGDNYSQEEYEQDLIDSGMNFIRHLGVKDTQFLYDHCKRMKEAGIIVSIGAYRVGEDEGVLVNLEDMGDLAKLGNVFFDVCNEFIGSNESEIQTVIDIAENLRSQGCLVSAGAWSGDDGKAMSDLFHEQYSKHDIESHHREWEEDSFKETLTYGKPVVFDEFFSQGNKTLQEIKDIFKTSVDLGIATNYYGYRFRLPHLSTRDPFDKDAIPKYAEELINR